jgi:catechol 2,3-dioxygenase-like lactoylglutathione lyase family enzyme
MGHDAARRWSALVSVGVHTMPVFTGVSHVDLTVRDADRSAAWYERVLGMEVLGELPELATPGVAARVVTMMNPATGMTFGLVQHDSGEDGEFSEFRVGLDHLSLAVASRDELERWVEHLDGCGVPQSAITEMQYGSVLVFRDPDNIQLELLALATNFQHPGLD